LIKSAHNTCTWRTFETVHIPLNGLLPNRLLRHAPQLPHFPVFATSRLVRDRRNARRRYIFLTAAARLSASCFMASAISASRRSFRDCTASAGRSISVICHRRSMPSIGTHNRCIPTEHCQSCAVAELMLGLGWDDRVVCQQANCADV
jgi:hypothetical protein